MNPRNIIGYYVNHGGKGHLNRALAVIPYLPERVVLFGSFPAGSFALPHNATYVELPSDEAPGYTVVLGQPYLYAPWGTNIHKRYAMILDAISKYQITHMHVDVSPEIISFAKILGLTTSTILMQGIRTDRAHTLGYEMADAVIAPFSRNYVDMDNYHIDKAVQFIGGISRFMSRAGGPSRVLRKIGQLGTNVLITTSFGGTAKDIEPLVQAAELLPDMTWHIIGNYQPTIKLPLNLHCYGAVNNPVDFLQAADYVIGSGGYNSIMEAAQFRKKYACFPEPRPYDEQTVAAASLARLHVAAVIQTYPRTAAQWRRLFAEMDGNDLKTFQSLVVPDAAERMAQAIRVAGLR